MPLSPGGKAGEDDIGHAPAEENSSGQHDQLHCRRVGKEPAPFEKQPAGHQQCHRAAAFGGKQAGQTAMPPDAGGGKRGQQSTLLGRTDDRGSCNRSA